MPGAGDDLVPVAEAHSRAQRPLFVPEGCETLLDRAQLGGERGVVPLREVVPELGAAIARGVDLATDVGKGSHALDNAGTNGRIP